MSEDRQNGVRLGDPLGSGAFGTVYKCSFLGKPHVVKKVKTIRDDYSYRSVMNEFVILSEINHPRVLKLAFFYQTSVDWNFVLEYMPNGSLRDLLQKFKKEKFKFNESDMLGMFMDVVVGIRHLHCKGIIHRDLKPENILLDDDYRAVVADFGVSKLVDSHRPEFHTAIGTPIYMAPETYLHLPYDKSVDTWALGIIFYEMAMMKYPFTEMDKARLLHPNLKFIVPQIDWVSRNYSVSLQDVLNLMLQRDPKKRAELMVVCSLRVLNPYYLRVKKEEEAAPKKRSTKGLF